MSGCPIRRHVFETESFRRLISLGSPHAQQQSPPFRWHSSRRLSLSTRYLSSGRKYDGLWGDAAESRSWHSFVKQSRDAERTIASVYQGLDNGHWIPEEEALVVRESGGSEVYGELSPASAVWLMRELGIGKNDTFFDLGCGTGKLLIIAALVTDVTKAVGLELSASRVRV